MKAARRKQGRIREYDFSTGIRGKYAKRYAKGTNVVVLSPDVARSFPDSESVNEALRMLLRVIRRTHAASAVNGRQA